MNKLQRIRLIRFMLLCFLLGLEVLTRSRFNSNEYWLLPTIVVPILGGFVLWSLFVRCPCCGKPFFRGWYGSIFATKCLHCGISIRAKDCTGPIKSVDWGTILATIVFAGIFLALFLRGSIHQIVGK
jgi:hypothetical protein